MAAKKTSSYSKEIIAKNQKTILSDFDGKTTAQREKNFVEEMEHYMKSKRDYRTTPYQAIKDMLNDATVGTPYTYQRLKYLNGLGLTKYKAEDLEKMTDRMAEKAMDEGEALYQHIMARDGEKLYDEIKAGKTATVKKKTAPKKRTVKPKTGSVSRKAPRKRTTAKKKV